MILLAGTVFANAQDLEGDVIGATAVAGDADEFAAGRSRSMARDDTQQFLFADLAPKAISAQDQRIAGFEFKWLGEGLGREFGSGAESGGEDVSLRMVLRFFGTQDTGFNEAPDVGMIVGETLDGAFAEQIEAAIADVGDKKLMAV